MSKRKSLFYSLLWVAVALGFTPYIYKCFGVVASMQYLLCYGAEKLLSLDNLVMFYVIFNYFKVPKEEQRRLLNIGLVSALAMRFVFIFTGSWLISMFHWLNYVFGVFLFYTGFKMLRGGGDNDSPEKFIARAQSLLPFLQKGAIIVSVIELSDILFAFDSVPASFAMTSNPVVIYAANVFAILGLRALYFLVLSYIEEAPWIDKFCGALLCLIAGSLVLPLIGRLLWVF